MHPSPAPSDGECPKAEGCLRFFLWYNDMSVL